MAILTLFRHHYAQERPISDVLVWTECTPVTLRRSVAQPASTPAPSAVFTDGAVYGTNPSSSAYGCIDNMPAMILQQVTVPEPSTLLLAASGLIGLLAYAWRKQK